MGSASPPVAPSGMPTTQNQHRPVTPQQSKLAFLQVVGAIALLFVTRLKDNQADPFIRAILFCSFLAAAHSVYEATRDFMHLRSQRSGAQPQQEQPE
jgi:hypothetical protein